jgi:hypothetical protein
MSARRIACAAVLFALAGCSTNPSTQEAKKEVDAVVIDEGSRQAAAKVARQTADSQDALEAGKDAKTREPATTPQ